MTDKIRITVIGHPNKPSFVIPVPRDVRDIDRIVKDMFGFYNWRGDPVEDNKSEEKTKGKL